MVDKDKYFDKTKQAKAVKWLNAKWVNKTCSCCGNNIWTVLDDLVMPMNFTGGGLVLGGATYPQVMANCANCGYTKFFNAVMMGIVVDEGIENAK